MNERTLAGANLSFGYSGASAPAVKDVTVCIVPGHILAIVGPNGSGKSTLIHLLAGKLAPQAGAVTYGPSPLAALTDVERAQRIAVVTQDEPNAFPTSVRDLVSMGRHPYLGRWQALRATDHDIIDQTMHTCSVSHLSDRDVRTLSGGERQRARIARALTQTPHFLLLDEPSVGLDLRHQMELFKILCQQRDAGLGIAVITHDLNLAARFATSMILMCDGAVVTEGTPREVLSGQVLQQVYEWPVVVGSHPGPGPDTDAPQATPLRWEVECDRE